jgi:uncharacterized protein
MIFEINSPATVLTLPGWQNSGPAHWQSRWEALHGYTRVDQHDWDRPLRGDWISRLEDVILSTTGPITLVAHSLGCLLVAAWTSHSRNTHRVQAALLVAPPDIEQDHLRSTLYSWSPIPLPILPFASTVIASSDDPFCSLPHAQHFAAQWGSRFVDLGPAGHINSDSEVGDWPVGHQFLSELTPWSPKNLKA